MRLLVSFSLLFVLALDCRHVTAEDRQSLRIDISPTLDRHDQLTPDCENWTLRTGSQATFTTGGIEFSIQPTLDGVASLVADWWKGGLVHAATFASDGVYVEGEQAGLRLKIHGLAEGKHSLATFHSSIWDDDIGPIDITVNGMPAATGLQPTRKVSNDADAAAAYFQFDAQTGQDVIVEMRRSTTPATDTADHHVLSRVILNGLELDKVDPAKKALKPNPAAGDEHVAERPTLFWQEAKGTVAHDIYLGTDRSAVAVATTSSPEYRGRRAEPQFATDVADSFATYYWRVDEVWPGNPETITQGDVWSFRVEHLAFPTAEGYGRFARGGRGGRVIEVTNLDDSGPGSLRAAVEAEGPRTVVFAVSGLITLESRLIIHNPYLTIAGQTAPGKGICLRKYNMGMGSTHDVVVRYVRVRPGNIAGQTLDGMGMAGTDHSIIDHCSISWTQDESFSSRAAKNITLQRTLIAEALNVAGHKKYPKGTQHGYAASIGGDIASFHHNLLADCAGRNWSLAGGLDQAGRHTGRLDIRNNVVYNWGHRTTDGGALQVIFVNNYYKPGAASHVFHVLKPERNHQFGPQDYFVSGNVMEGHYSADQPLAGVVEPRDEPLKNFLVDTPFFESYVTTQSAEEAFEDVLADVGCNVPELDEHDRRIIDETRSGTTSFKGSVTGYAGLPDTQDDVGGWEDYPEEHRPADWDSDHDGLPDQWEAAHGLNRHSAPSDFSDANADPDGDGYTNLDDYLNDLTVRK
jgi:hypothetical protein